MAALRTVLICLLCLAVSGMAVSGTAAAQSSSAKEPTGKASAGKASAGKAATGKAATGKAATGKAAAGKAAAGKAAAGKAAKGKKSKNPWQNVRTPAKGPPRAIGDYSAGCLQGAQTLPLDGEGYQVMHPSRMRYFGHPHLVDFLQTLGRGVVKKGLKVMLLGDLSQPRGGRAKGGHASHQNGLDVDIWFWHPKRAENEPLSTQERENLKARSVLNGKTKSVRKRWSAYVAQVLRLTADDPRVERVFVHPIIKRDLCAQPGNAQPGKDKDRAWLAKIRPWYGHDDHFHVRLACPDDSPDCRRQDPVPPGDGCQELEWWFSEEAQADRAQARKRYQRKVIGKPKMPPQCWELLKRPDVAEH